MPDTSPVADLEQTEVGSYFVANYPPFSVWTPDAVGTDARAALASPAPPDTPLGVYLHIPFCRKRCHFCYFRVYTDKNAKEVEQYLDLLGREWELYAGQPAMAGRPFNFVYFGGGTPSFLSTRQLETLVKRVTASRSWDDRRRDHVRVRAGHHHSSQAGGDSRHRRHPAEPRRRELQRSHPRAERPRAPLAGDHAGLPGGARPGAFPRSTSISSPACSARPTRTGRTASSARSISRPTA